MLYAGRECKINPLLKLSDLGTFLITATQCVGGQVFLVQSAEGEAMSCVSGPELTVHG